MGAVASTTTRTVLPPLDPQLVNRVVGYLEYRQALSMLDRLLEIASLEEFKVLDEIVQGRDECTIFTNLSRHLEKEPSTLTEVARKPDDDFARRGLAWIMALARVELGAMAAGFTEKPGPFDLYRPSWYELAPYQEILEDSMRTHYWALRNDPLVPTLRNGATPEPQAIAYARRVTVALEFLRAARKVKETEYNQLQTSELNVWQSQLGQLESYMLYGVLRLHDPAVLQTSQSTSVRLKACLRLQRIAQAEIRAGRRRFRRGHGP